MRPTFPHRGPVGTSQWAERRVASVARANAALRSHFATAGRNLGKTAATGIYGEVRLRAPGVFLAYGIDAKGPWATIGESIARAATPAAALDAALAKHQEKT